MSDPRSSSNYSLSTPASYTDETTRLVGVLQNIQQLLTHDMHATLADVVALVQQLQANHGETAELEDIIQQLVAEQLLTQYRKRQTQRTMVAA